MVSGRLQLVHMPQRLNNSMPENPVPVAADHLRPGLCGGRDAERRRVLQEICLRAGAGDRKANLMSPISAAQVRYGSDEQNNKRHRWLPEIYLR